MHLAFALDGHIASTFQLDLGILLHEQISRYLAGIDTTRFGIRFHSRCRIDRVPNDREPRISVTHNVCHDGTTMKPTVVLVSKTGVLKRMSQSAVSIDNASKQANSNGETYHRICTYPLSGSSSSMRVSEAASIAPKAKRAIKAT